jgi:hypothetical protein
MTSKIGIAFLTLALAIAAAAGSTYHMTLNQNTWVGGHELKAGTYKVQVQGDKATIKSGKTVVETPVTVQQQPKAIEGSSLTIDTSSGKPVARDFQAAGSRDRIVFQPASAPANGME